MNRSNQGKIGRSKAGSDFLQLDPAEAPAGGLSDWLTERLRAAISDGRLPIGTRLPATRVLAADLQVSRGVVTEAYQRLTEDGQLTPQGRAGTTVAAAPLSTTTATSAQPTAARRPTTTAALATGSPNARTAQGSPHPRTGSAPGDSYRPATARTTTRPGGPTTSRPSTAATPEAGSPTAGTRPVGSQARTGPAPAGSGRNGSASAGSAGPGSPALTTVVAEPGLDVFDALRAVPARIDLTPGVPDLAAFPRAAWLRAERAVLNDLESAEFGYGDPAGTPALRRAVANWLARYRGVSAHPDDLIIVAGVSQAIGLVAQVLRPRGITEIAVEDPGSLGSRQHLQNWGLHTPPIPVDEGGLRVDLLRESGARVVMATPAHHFPTGVVLDGERRRELIQWAAEGGLILEDDYDAEHRYDRPPVPALRAMLADQVIYAGSVSKLLAPSLRIGWMLPPPQYKDDLIAMKRLADLGNAALPQLTLAHLMESGELERQLRFLRRRHRTRRDAMVRAVANYLPSATVHGAAAGLHLTITFDSSLNDVDLAAAALQKGVKAHPLSWHCQLPHAPGLVLGYAARTPTELTEAIATIAEVL